MIILQALPLWPSIFKLMLKAGKTVTLLVQMVSPSPLLSLALRHNKNQTCLEVHAWGAGYEAAELHGVRTFTLLWDYSPVCAIPWPDWVTGERLRLKTEGDVLGQSCHCVPDGQEGFCSSKRLQEGSPAACWSS